MRNKYQFAPLLVAFQSIFGILMQGGEVDAQAIIPAVRNFSWNPGMMSKGGVPARTAVCASLSPIGNGTDDSGQINNAIANCPSGGVVYLNPGSFTVNNYILVNKSISLRGAGPGITLLTKTNGARLRTSTVVSGTNGILTPVDPATYSYDAQPIVVVGPSRWPTYDGSSSQNLTADAVQGSYSVTVANAGGFKVGAFVLLDETSGASWQPVPPGFGCTDNQTPTPCPPFVWQGDRVAWNMHWPEQQFQDDNDNANQNGPYDTSPGVLPAAMSWFSRPDRPVNEIKQISSISGNTVTFTSPLTIGYRVNHAAQLTGYSQTANSRNSVHVTNAGVEDLTVIGGADGAVRFENAAYSWAKNVEITQWLGEGVAVDGSFRVELRDSYIHTASWPEPGGVGYAISLAAGSSEILIENNISIDVNKVMVSRSSGAGSVVGYNYMDNGWDFDTPTWVEVGINASHMAGPHHVLFEGNYSFNADSDYTHGNAQYLTFFRNVLTGFRRDFNDSIANNTGNMRAVGLAYGSWYDSFVGNVLGLPGKMTGWTYTDPAMSCDAGGNNCTGNNANWSGNDIWILGYDPERWGMHPDPKVLSTVIRDGNYDFLTNSQRWHNTAGGFAMPNSMYLTSKPAFFGRETWPWGNPATGATYTLPAKARYDAIVHNHTHDYSGDGRSDIVLRDTSGNIMVWLMNGAQVPQWGLLGPMATTWSLVGQRDFDGDGKHDWLWRDTSGNLQIWFMNGLKVSSAVGLGNVPATWSVVGTGDFDGDGKGDILWRDAAGNVAIWLSNGSTGSLGAVPGVMLGNVPTSWTIAGIGDFDGDGRSDVLWRHDASGYLAIWFMNGTLGETEFVGNTPTVWSIVGTGDFNGDGKSDILWRDTGGNVGVTFMDGAQVMTTAGFGSLPVNWSVVETGDFDGDGRSDILWRDNAGNTVLWFMNGVQFKTTASLGVIPSSWTIAGANVD